MTAAAAVIMDSSRAAAKTRVPVRIGFGSSPIRIVDLLSIKDGKDRKMPDDAAQQAWVTRVLGVSFPAVGAGGLSQVTQRWQATRAKVDADLASFRSALASHPSVKDDPRAKFVAAAAAEIPNLLPKAGLKLQAALKRSGPDAAGQAIEAVAEYRRALDGSKPLEALESFAGRGLRLPLTVRATLAAGLDEVEAALREAA